MATIIPLKYALDLTGTNINNSVVNESFTPDMKNIRTIIPDYAPYYTESLRVYNSSNNALLSRGIHYHCVDIVSLPSAQSGKEICTAILLADKTIITVRIEYQALGGNYQKDYTSTKLLMDNLTADNRPINWPSILNRPTTFDPQMHLHNPGDVIGFEYVVHSLEQLKKSIEQGDEISHTELYRQIEDIQSRLKVIEGGGINNNLMSIITDAKIYAQAAYNLATTFDSRLETVLNNSEDVLFRSQQ